MEIISRSISTKVWDLAGIELVIPGSAVREVSAVIQITDCAMQPCKKCFKTRLCNQNFFCISNKNKYLVGMVEAVLLSTQNRLKCIDKKIIIILPQNLSVYLHLSISTADSYTFEKQKSSTVDYPVIQSAVAQWLSV